MCIFCEKIEKEKWVFKCKSVVVIEDEYPVTKGHVLIVPIRCVPNFFHLTPNELSDINDAIHIHAENIMTETSDVDGFNIGWNVGGSAGQTVEHCHCHLIPRRTGDCENPVGGVRNVIPEFGDYTK